MYINLNILTEIYPQKCLIPGCKSAVIEKIKPNL